MKTAPAVAAAALLAWMLPILDQQPQPFERPFAKGGTIRLELAAADYRISGTTDEKIRIRSRTSQPEDADKARVEVDVRGTAATIRTAGPKNGLHFDIEVPQRSDLDIDLSAGDVEVRGIEGNKALSMWAGDVNIDVGRAGLYRQVDASVRVGDISAAPFDISKGGILRSFTWRGGGQYTLRVRLFAGDLTLR